MVNHNVFSVFAYDCGFNSNAVIVLKSIKRMLTSPSYSIYGLRTTQNLSAKAQSASARNLSDLSIFRVRSLLSLTLLTPLAIAIFLESEISLMPSFSSNFFMVVALSSRVNITIPAVWISNCKQYVDHVIIVTNLR